MQDPNVPLYISLDYDGVDSNGIVHGHHALRVKSVVSKGEDDYLFTLVNPWNNEEVETRSLDQLKERNVHFSYFTIPSTPQEKALVVIQKQVKMIEQIDVTFNHITTINDLEKQQDVLVAQLATLRINSDYQNAKHELGVSKDDHHQNVKMASNRKLAELSKAFADQRAIIQKKIINDCLKNIREFKIYFGFEPSIEAIATKKAALLKDLEQIIKDDNVSKAQTALGINSIDLAYQTKIKEITDAAEKHIQFLDQVVAEKQKRQDKREQLRKAIEADKNRLEAERIETAGCKQYLQQINYTTHIDQLRDKRSQFKQNGNKEAETAVNDLVNKLVDIQVKFLDLTVTKADFKKDSIKLLEAAQNGELKNHRGLQRVIHRILLVLTAGIASYFGFFGIQKQSQLRPLVLLKTAYRMTTLPRLEWNRKFSKKKPSPLFFAYQ